MTDKQKWEKNIKLLLSHNVQVPKVYSFDQVREILIEANNTTLDQVAEEIGKEKRELTHPNMMDKGGRCILCEEDFSYNQGLKIALTIIKKHRK